MSKKSKNKKKKNSRRSRRKKQLKQVANTKMTLGPATFTGTALLPSNPYGYITVSGTCAGLSKKESRELQRLKDEREALIKNKQREKFKALPSDVRQQLVNEINITKMVNDIKETTIEKSERECELEGRDFPGFLSLGSGLWFSNPSILSTLREIFTEDEMVQMHNNIEAEKILLED